MNKALLVATFVLLTLTLVAQTPTTLRVDVRLVNVVTTVTDASGKFVPNLTADDFTVFEDGEPQKITHFTQDHNVPVSVGMLLDTSGSMAGKMQAATGAVERFLNRIHSDDDIFLMTFSKGTYVEQDFTSDRRKLARAMMSLRVGGSTYLYEALTEAIEKVQRGKHDKRAILVISDGMDSQNKSGALEEVLRKIRGSEVLVYGLGASQTVYADPNEHVPFTLPTPSSTARGPSVVTNARGNATRRGSPNPVTGVNMVVLRQFAENSGGQSFLLADTFVESGNSDLEKVLTTIAEELRGQYTLGYYPSTVDSGGFHSIKVSARGNYNIRARSGYQGRKGN